jgi:Family of unknown function (DUF6328)
VTEKQPGLEQTARARGEPLERVLDRNVNELLQELRVVLTGVQILFAFLLTLAFTARFRDLGTFDTTVYTVTLMSSAAATVVLIAPVSFHRILFRRQRKRELVVFANRSLVVALALLLVSICSALLLVLDVVLGRWPAVAGCACIVAVGVVLWYMVPLRIRRATPP